MKKVFLFLFIILIISIIAFIIIESANAPTHDSNFEALKEQVKSMTEVHIINADMGGASYSIQQGTTSYTVNKKFLKKPTEVVVGITNDVSGDISVRDNSVFVNLDVDTSTLVTGSEGRDKYVREHLPNIANVRIDGQAINLSEEGTYQGYMIMTLTLGETSKDVTLGTSIKVTDDKVVASGSGEILMSDFNIEPPSTLGIYTVDDKLVISFDISATKLYDL